MQAADKSRDDAGAATFNRFRIAPQIKIALTKKLRTD